MSTDPWAALLDAVSDQYDAASAARDPETWATSVAGLELWSKQREIMASVRDNRRTVVRAGHGVSKSHTAAVLACWWVATHAPGEALVVTTAPTGRQVSAVLWGEITRLHRAAALPGEIGMDSTWRIGGQLVALGRKPADGDEVAFQGLHARHVLAILDEASGLPAALWEAVEGVTTSAGSRILAIGNPDRRGGPFERAFEPGSSWSQVHVSVLDSPVFTGEAVSDDLLAVLPSREWVADARRQWGEASPVYLSRVLGEFPTTDADALVSWEWIRAAQVADIAPTWPAVFGADIARFGADSTVVVLRAGGHVQVIDQVRGRSLTETAGVLLRLSQGTGAAVRVDDTGVGGGVTDMLKEQGVNVFGVIAAASAADSEHFANVRAEAYWRLRQCLENGWVRLPDDDELAQQLARLRYRLDSRGRILIESKADMRARGEPSPDKADALALTYAEAPTGLRRPSQMFNIG